MLGANARDPQDPLLGDHVARAVGGVILLELRVGRLQPCSEHVGRHHRGLALTPLEQHRGIGCRHSDRHPARRRDRGQEQPLEQPGGENLANLRVAQPLLRQESAIGLLAELAVEALGAGDLRDLGVDDPPRQGKAVFVRERDQRPLLDQVVEDRFEVADDVRIIGIGALLPRLLQAPLHRIAHLALGHDLIAHFRERAAAQPEAHVAAAEIGQIGERETAEDGNQHEHHDPGADLGLGDATEEGEHRIPRANGGGTPL